MDKLGIIDLSSVRGGRIECTMQNVADQLVTRQPSRLTSESHENLDTFIVFNERRKVTSSAKRHRKMKDDLLHQTPDGSFLDVTRNGFELLTSCGVQMPKMESNHCYVDSWPPFIVLLHPAMGPLWDITRQKVALLPFGSHLVFSCQNSTKKNRIRTFLQQQDIDNSVGSEIISI
jgi:hypothetical protein